MFSGGDSVWSIIFSIIIIVGLSILVAQKYRKPKRHRVDRRTRKQVTDEDIEIEKIRSKRPPPGGGI